MIERYSPVPISEPNVLPPILEPGIVEEAEFAYTKKQREAIRKRDNETCQARGIVPHKCDPKHLHVHHLIPQRYSKELKPPIDPDFAENGITICVGAHRTVHPDMDEVYKNYQENPDGFKELGPKREQLLKNKIIYWDDKWDRQLHTRAIQNTQRAKSQGWQFPTNRHKH